VADMLPIALLALFLDVLTGKAFLDFNPEIGGFIGSNDFLADRRCAGGFLARRRRCDAAFRFCDLELGLLGRFCRRRRVFAAVGAGCLDVAFDAAQTVEDRGNFLIRLADFRVDVPYGHVRALAGGPDALGILGDLAQLLVLVGRQARIVVEQAAAGKRRYGRESQKHEEHHQLAELLFFHGVPPLLDLVRRSVRPSN